MVYNNITISQNVAASLSCFSCLAVVLTVIVFKSLRAKQYIRWVFYIAVNDMCATLALAIGRTSNSVACWFQGILTNYNSLASVCWITFISYKVYRIILRNQKQLDLGEDKTVAQIEIYDNTTTAVLDNNQVVHIICWGLPLIATLLPLTANYRYENSSDDDWTSYGNWCVLVDANGKDSGYALILFKIASFYLWIWCAILINVAYLYLTKRLFQESFAMISSQEIIVMMSDTIHKLEYYPYILIVCWLPSTIIEISSLDDNVVGYGIATFLTLLQGLLSSIVFFVVNPDVRLRWYNLLCCGEQEDTEEGDEDGLIRDLIRKNSVDEYNSMVGSFSEWTNSVDKYTNEFSNGLNSGGGSLNNSYSIGANNSFNVGTTGVYGMRNNNHYIYSALTSAPPSVAPITRPPAEPSRQSSLFADHLTEDDESIDDGRR